MKIFKNVNISKEKPKLSVDLYAEICMINILYVKAKKLLQKVNKNKELVLILLIFKKFKR